MTIFVFRLMTMLKSQLLNNYGLLRKFDIIRKKMEFSHLIKRLKYYIYYFTVLMLFMIFFEYSIGKLNECISGFIRTSVSRFPYFVIPYCKQRYLQLSCHQFRNRKKRKCQVSQRLIVINKVIYRQLVAISIVTRSTQIIL